MPNHSNIIDPKDSLLSALIDPVYTPMEVFQYWQQMAPVFSYLGPAPLNKEELIWDDHRMIASIKDTKAVVAPEPNTGKVGDSECLDTYFSLPLYMPGISQANEQILAFMVPDISVGNNHIPSTYPGWNPAHPILLSLTRNITYKSPYFILSIDINPGTWGYRHLQYKAIAEVFQCLYEMEGADPVEGEIVKRAGKLSDLLYEWETREVDFHRIREELWAAAYQLVKRFSKGETSILRSLPYESPVDLSVSRPGNYQPDIPVYDPDAFKHEVWIEQLGWDSATKSRAIAYWVSKKSTGEWDHFFEACMRGVKSTWPSLVKVLKQPPVSGKDIERLTTFLADINWPGAYEALTCLQAMGKPALQYVDNAIEKATQQNDEPWLEYLQYVRDILIDDGSEEAN
jgi:hypothetical protein